MINRLFKILIVDDKDAWSNFARQTLSEAGFSVVVNDAIDNGTRVPLRTYLDSFDLIILDLIKAKHDSMKFLSTSSESTTPKIAVTSNPTIAVAREAMKNGANTISPKPYDELSLLRMVNENLRV